MWGLFHHREPKKAPVHKIQSCFTVCHSIHELQLYYMDANTNCQPLFDNTSSRPTTTVRQNKDPVLSHMSLPTDLLPPYTWHYIFNNGKSRVKYRELACACSLCMIFQKNVCQMELTPNQAQWIKAATWEQSRGYGTAGTKVLWLWKLSTALNCTHQHHIQQTAGIM